MLYRVCVTAVQRLSKGARTGHAKGPQDDLNFHDEHMKKNLHDLIFSLTDPSNLNDKKKKRRNVVYSHKTFEFSFP